MRDKKDPRSNTLPKVLLRLGLCAVIVYGCPMVLVAILNFPSAVDEPFARNRSGPQGELPRAKAFYENSYTPEASKVYVETARLAAEAVDIEGRIKAFVNQFGLADKRVLDVGAGSGLLQDIVTDYTALDIASSARRFFHKPFVQASATDMPFQDNEFDALWTIWVLEHVPKPEWALLEMRRVVRNEGLIFLAPAWNCLSWAAEGYEVRPYSDFDFAGKVAKASVVVRRLPPLRLLSLYPVRFLRLSMWLLAQRPTALRYDRLNPTFERYWVPDSDAVNSIDSYEAYLWFVSRGDMCLNCGTAGAELLESERWPLIIRIRKGSSSMHARP